jgi:hypothetical protein
MGERFVYYRMGDKPTKEFLGTDDMVLEKWPGISPPPFPA